MKSRIITASLALFAFVAPVTTAAAQSYCFWAGGLLVDGSSATERLKIVVSSVPRQEIPGRSSDRPWCLQNRSSLGGHSSGRLVEAPKLGEVRMNGYRVWYKGNKVGRDRFVIEHRWLAGNSNKWQKALQIVEVEIVPSAF